MAAKAEKVHICSIIHMYTVCEKFTKSLILHTLAKVHFLSNFLVSYLNFSLKFKFKLMDQKSNFATVCCLVIFHTNEDEGEGVTLAFWRLMRSFERSRMTSLASLANGTGQWMVHGGVARHTRWRPQGIQDPHALVETTTFWKSQ